jgi:lipoate-protein ligase B
VDVHGVTRHGFALNVHTDPDYWEGIIGCGLDYPVVNLGDLLPETPAMEDVIRKVVDSFGAVFEYEMLG